MTLRQWLTPPVGKIAYVVYTYSEHHMDKPLGMLQKKHLDADIYSLDKMSVLEWDKRYGKKSGKIFDGKEYDFVWIIRLERMIKDDE